MVNNSLLECGHYQVIELWLSNTWRFANRSKKKRCFFCIYFYRKYLSLQHRTYIIGILSKALEGICVVSGLCPTATLCSDCLCFDLLVHKLASSKTTVDLNKAKGMLLFHKLLEREHSGGGGRNAGHQNSHWTMTHFCQSLIVLCGHQVEMYSVFAALVLNCGIFL